MIDGPLIDVDDLSRLLSGHEPVIIADCRFNLADTEAGERAYRQGHIPGACYLHLDRDLSGAKGTRGGRHPLPEQADFQNTMRRIGLDDHSLLVAYDQQSGPFAARLWWLVGFFGHLQVAVLDGGIDAWRDAGYTLESDERVSSRQGNFSARTNSRPVTDFDALQNPSTGTVLIDSREIERYLGLEEPIDPIAGHIPGALNLPWQDALDSDGTFRPSEEQRERFSFLTAGASPVLYCGSGVTACVNLLSLALCGIHDARLYPGSWSDWCQRRGKVASDKSAGSARRIKGPERP